MVVLYYFDASVRLVDPTVADARMGGDRALDRRARAGLDRLRRALPDAGTAEPGRAGDRRGRALARSAGSGELFAARAAYLQVGAMLGTIMAANVLLVIIPAHRKLVTAIDDDREPDPGPLLEAKNRSVHNNYLTLPVLFTMLVGHFAFMFGADEAWLAFVAIAVLLAFIRLFFNLWHAGRRQRAGSRR